MVGDRIFWCFIVINFELLDKGGIEFPGTRMSGKGERERERRENVEEVGAPSWFGPKASRSRSFPKSFPRARVVVDLFA